MVLCVCVTCKVSRIVQDASGWPLSSYTSIFFTFVLAFFLYLLINTYILHINKFFWNYFIITFELKVTDIMSLYYLILQYVTILQLSKLVNFFFFGVMNSFEILFFSEPWAQEFL